MELTACSACQASVSPEAFSCPKCGHPLKPAPEGFLHREAKDISKVVAVIVIVVVALFVGRSLLGY
jgi:uncharacterized paraquat-inducible protein A